MTAAARLPAVLLALVVGACTSCPPDWIEDPPRSDRWLYGAGTAGEVFVDADGKALALSRAARVIADALGLDVERRLSVRDVRGRLFVEAVGPDGPVDALDALELVEVVSCERRVHALLRLPRPAEGPADR